MRREPRIHRHLCGNGRCVTAFCSLIVEEAFATHDDGEVTCKNCLRILSKAFATLRKP